MIFVLFILRSETRLWKETSNINILTSFKIMLFLRTRCCMIFYAAYEETCAVSLYHLFFHQVSYDLTGSLTRNKDSLPQILLLTMKCKYPVSTVTSIWAHCGIRVCVTHSPQPTANQTTQSVVIFVFMCFIPYKPDSSVCVYEVNGTCQMLRCCGLWDTGSHCVAALLALRLTA